MTTIRTPIAGWNGTFNGDVFIDGVCEDATEGNLAYYRRHGYLIDQTQKPARKTTTKAGTE